MKIKQWAYKFLKKVVLSTTMCLLSLKEISETPIFNLFNYLMMQAIFRKYFRNTKHKGKGLKIKTQF